MSDHPHLDPYGYPQDVVTWLLESNVENNFYRSKPMRMPSDTEIAEYFLSYADPVKRKKMQDDADAYWNSIVRRGK